MTPLGSQQTPPGTGFMGFDRLTELAMIKDGVSNTIALMETAFRPRTGRALGGAHRELTCVDPIPLDVRYLHGDGRPFGGHPGGMNVAMADGSVRFLRSSIDPKILAAAITIAGGEQFDLD